MHENVQQNPNAANLSNEFCIFEEFIRLTGHMQVHELSNAVLERNITCLRDQVTCYLASHVCTVTRVSLRKSSAQVLKILYFTVP